MSHRNVFGQMIGAVAIIALIVIMSSYATGILSANQENVNVSGTAYEDTYNSSTKIQATTLTFVPYAGVFVGVGLLFLGIGWMFWRVKRF